VFKPVPPILILLALINEPSGSLKGEQLLDQPNELGLMELVLIQLTEKKPLSW
jgi:hypothetical protein